MNAFSVETSFLVAAQTSIILGLLHGLSPCEHSWPILTPFAIGSKNMKRVMRIGTALCLGSVSACLVLGAVLGAVGSITPTSWSIYMGAATSGILIVLGVALFIKPNLFHVHDEGEHGHSHHDEDDHDHEEEEHGHSDHDHGHIHAANYSGNDTIYNACGETIKKPAFKHGIYWGMFSLGFINMIIPCPTLAVMYGYALNAKSMWHGTWIFLLYGITTTILLMFLAFLLVKASQLMKVLGREQNEALLSRISGVLIAAFGVYMVLIQFPAFKHLKFYWIL